MYYQNRKLKRREPGVIKMDEEFGTPAYMLRRNEDPETSHEAAELVDTTNLEQMVFNVIKSFGAHGCIGDDIVRCMPNRGVQTVSPRYAPLLRKNKIYRLGDKRKGNTSRQQLVMRAERRKKQRDEFQLVGGNYG